MSAGDAIETLKAAVKTAKGRAALGVLETELQAGGEDARAKANDGKRDGSPSFKGLVNKARDDSARGEATA